MSGRLDLLVGQIKRNAEDDNEDILNSTNMIVYEDHDSSNSDLDTENNSSDDDQWEEEEESAVDEKMDVSDNDD